MRRRWLVRRFGEDGGGAAGGSDEAGDDAQECRFAGAVFADDDGAGACGEGCGDVAEGGEGAVDLGDGLQFGGGAARCAVGGLG